MRGVWTGCHLGRGLAPEQQAGLTLKSWTPMHANMNCRRVVTRTMFPMVRMATNTHCTTCWGGKPGQHLPALQGCPSPEGRWGGGAQLVGGRGACGGTAAQPQPPPWTQKRWNGPNNAWAACLESGLPAPSPPQGPPSLSLPGVLQGMSLPRILLALPRVLPSPFLPGVTFSPLALLMARRGRSTLSTLRIFTTEMALDLGAARVGLRAASCPQLCTPAPASPSLLLMPRALCPRMEGPPAPGLDWLGHH